MKSLVQFGLCAALAIGAATPARAEERADRVYDRIMAEVVEPGYAALAKVGAANAEAWNAFCLKPDSAGFDGLRASYGRFGDAWASIEFVRSGPAAENFRADRLNFWPERKNAVERALKALLAAGDETDLTPQAMATASAAVQGLPALERLLFDQGAAATEFGTDGPGGFRCKAAAAIAANALAIAQELAAEPPDGRPKATDATRAALATDIVTAIVGIKDRKLQPVLGTARVEAKPRLAEAWRSGRSLRNIELNLGSLSAIAKIASDDAPETLALPSAVESARKAAAALTGDLGAFASGGERGAVILLLDAVYAVEQRAALEIPAVLGVTIGFSSADGD